MTEFPALDVCGDPGGVGDPACQQQPERNTWQLPDKFSGDRHAAPAHDDVEDDFDFAQTVPVEKTADHSGTAEQQQQNKYYHAGQVARHRIKQRRIAAGYQKKYGTMVELTQKFTFFRIFARVVKRGTAEHENQTYAVEYPRRHAPNFIFHHAALQQIKYPCCRSKQTGEMGRSIENFFPRGVTFFAFRHKLSPAEKQCAPGKSGSEAHDQDIIALFQLTGTVQFVKAEPDRSTGGVAVPLDILVNLFRHIQTRCHR